MTKSATTKMPKVFNLPVFEIPEDTRPQAIIDDKVQDLIKTKIQDKQFKTLNYYDLIDVCAKLKLTLLAVIKSTGANDKLFSIAWKKIHFFKLPNEFIVRVPITDNFPTKTIVAKASFHISLKDEPEQDRIELKIIDASQIECLAKSIKRYQRRKPVKVALAIANVLLITSVLVGLFSGFFIPHFFFIGIAIGCSFVGTLVGLMVKAKAERFLNKTEPKIISESAVKATSIRNEHLQPASQNPMSQRHAASSPSGRASLYERASKGPYEASDDNPNDEFATKYSRRYSQN